MTQGHRLAALRTLWIVAILAFLYIPIISVVLASLANTRYMRFPHRIWTVDAYRDALGSFTTWQLHTISLSIALSVVLISTLLGTLGAVAFARYDWRGRGWFQRLLVLPIFFPQPVLGLALLLSFTAIGISPSWKTAVVAHLVWIVPIVTLVISVRFFGYDVAQEEAAYDLGASNLQVFREVTMPQIWPGVFSGILFGFLLSWSNLPLSVFTSGPDTPLPVWLFTRTATNYSPLVPSVAVIGTVVSAMIVIGAALLLWASSRLRSPAR
ncbi:ABC transporter permease [Jannaschia seohaensis]|uniref:Spermidine/putrescine transport system permease protein n=1 Tax=Jannaschia seohaensis TaxID=475081 RepID=A0A2Y9B8L3_9RHOB|nr:ABC transporter permease [Jannaschia seohaensis]PWJ10063.1 spermidine/putrescine transport system permease protein [Jannaschia seohaensis]SSA51828.1 spermidine/putrescine transport system permease protein [Jannaschia seohaensis]